jgi:signal transduction histidine kinase
MLEAARLEDGRLALKRDRVDLRRVAREAIHGIKPLITDRHILTIDDTADSVDAVQVLGDEDRLVTIVTNLLENAIKYSPKGGAIRCTVGTDEGTGTVRVIDQGVGISADDLPRLFNRFERIHNRETSHVGGTGLGLYLSRELARQHGGDLLVESRPGKGSTFTLRVPIAGPRVEENHQAASGAEPVPAAEPAPAAVEVPRLRVVPGGDAEITA